MLQQPYRALVARTRQHREVLKPLAAAALPLLASLLCFLTPLKAFAAGPNSIREPALAQDGPSLFNEGPETQATFAAVWGDAAAVEWIHEHDAALSEGHMPGPRIGFLYAGTSTANPLFTQGLIGGLESVGLHPGENMTMLWRFADGHADRLPELASDLVEQHPDVIVTPTSAESLVLKRLTQSIPIVTMTVADPVGIGLVASLDRPGANITGVIQQPVAFNADRLALLQRAIPNARRIAVLANVSSADDPSLIALRDPAATLGLDVQLLPVSSADDLPRAFVAASNESADAMMVLAGSLFTANRSLIVQLAAEHRIPTLYPSRLFIEAGGLMDYAFQEQERGALTAEYVSQILAGADPAELSMTPPPDTELVVNLPAARAIGFQVPGALLTEATVVLP